MRIILAYLFISILSLKTSAQPDSRRHFRTDGIYFFDNGIDTLNLIKDGLKMQLDMIKMMQDEGIIPQKPFTHADSVVVNSEGSCRYEFLVFFNDTSGTSYHITVRNDDNTSSNLHLIRALKKITLGDSIVTTTDPDSLLLLKYRLGNLTFRGINYVNDSTIQFIKIGKGLDFMERIAVCTIKKDGNMQVKVYPSFDPMFALNDDLYIFIPYDKIPPDLVEAKRYFELKK
jgi:hypothetical protein